MKRPLQFVLALSLLLLSVGCTPKFSRRHIPSMGYETIKAEKTRTVLILPPIGKMLDNKAKAFISSVVSTTLAEKGYYVLSPPSAERIMEGFDKADPEWYVENSTRRLHPQYGADAVVLIRVNSWNVNIFGGTRNFDVSCLIKSVHSDKVLFENRIYREIGSPRSYDQDFASMAITDILFYLLVGPRDVGREGISQLLAPFPDGPYAPRYNLL